MINRVLHPWLESEHNLKPPCPPISPATRLAETKNYELAGWVLEPPPADATPKITAEDAVREAWVKGAEGGSRTAEPVFALLPKGGTIERDTLVWLVRFPDVCVPLLGADEPPYCQVMDWNVLVDSQTGRFITAFGQGPPTQK